MERKKDKLTLTWAELEVSLKQSGLLPKEEALTNITLTHPKQAILTVNHPRTPPPNGNHTISIPKK